MACRSVVLLLVALTRLVVSVRINFTSCQNAEWSCVNDVPNEIVYTCSDVRSHDYIIHLKDYYTDHITSLTVQNCRDLRVVLDCPILQRASQLQRFKVKNCDRLEFVALSAASLLQTPSEVIIENVQEITSLPRRIFKSPTSITELKCLGSNSLKEIKISNSKINVISSKAFYNVTGIKNIEFDNVTIADIRNQAIEAVGVETVFKLTKSSIDKIDYKGIVVQSNSAIISENTFSDILGNSINITADNLRVSGNKFREIRSNGLVFKSVNTDITNNDIQTLKSNALSQVTCSRKRSNRKQFNFDRNRIEHIEPHALTFDYTSCKSAGTSVAFRNNKMDCKCRNILFLTSTTTTNTELFNTILDAAFNNTCLQAPCILPIDIVRILLESDMCQIALDPQVMCLLYSDKHTNTSDVSVDEDVTEPAPTFYLIRQANSRNREGVMTPLDRDDLLNGSHLNMTNRTAIKVVFDSSRDFVETLRSTSSSRKRHEEPKTAPREEYVNKCVGPQCRNNAAYDKQKALDFYKYVYAQLRPPRENVNKKTL